MSTAVTQTRCKIIYFPFRPTMLLSLKMRKKIRRFKVPLTGRSQIKTIFRFSERKNELYILITFLDRELENE